MAESRVMTSWQDLFRSTSVARIREVCTGIECELGSRGEMVRIFLGGTHSNMTTLASRIVVAEAEIKALNRRLVMLAQPSEEKNSFEKLLGLNDLGSSLFGSFSHTVLVRLYHLLIRVVESSLLRRKQDIEAASRAIYFLDYLSKEILDIPDDIEKQYMLEKNNLIRITFLWRDQALYDKYAQNMILAYMVMNRCSPTQAIEHLIKARGRRVHVLASQDSPDSFLEAILVLETTLEILSGQIHNAFVGPLPVTRLVDIRTFSGREMDEIKPHLQQSILDLRIFPDACYDDKRLKGLDQKFDMLFLESVGEKLEKAYRTILAKLNFVDMLKFYNRICVVVGNNLELSNYTEFFLKTMHQPFCDFCSHMIATQARSLDQVDTRIPTKRPIIAPVCQSPSIDFSAPLSDVLSAISKISKGQLGIASTEIEQCDQWGETLAQTKMELKLLKENAKISCRLMPVLANSISRYVDVATDEISTLASNACKSFIEKLNQESLDSLEFDDAAFLISIKARLDATMFNLGLEKDATIDDRINARIAQLVLKECEFVPVSSSREDVYKALYSIVEHLDALSAKLAWSVGTLQAIRQKILEDATPEVAKTARELLEATEESRKSDDTLLLKPLADDR